MMLKRRNIVQYGLEPLISMKREVVPHGKSRQNSSVAPWQSQSLLPYEIHDHLLISVSKTYLQTKKLQH